MSTDPRTRSWVEIQPQALRRNLHRIREAIGGSSAIIPMVKADGYGLGMEKVVETLELDDPLGYGVATLEEGLRLREAGVDKPVIVFSPIPPGAYESAVAHALTVTISDVDSLERLSNATTAAGVKARFQVEVDTGMGRSGFDWSTVSEWGPAVAERVCATLRWEGCYTHFHSADVEEDAATMAQWHRFKEALGALEGRSGSLTHACNAAAALRYPALAADAVRPGIFLYGGAVGPGVARPEEVVRVRARVTFIRDVAEGATLGYRSTYRSRGAERWATLGIGYGDGLPRSLGNRGSALLSGRRVPIIGRISMDMTVVDITGAEGVSVGDTATLIGTDKEESITLDEVADLAGTISYEILTGLTPRLSRVWLASDDA